MRSNGRVPKISVCLPVQNSELWVSEAIESIIDQSFEDWEIVVTDDGSTDATKEVLAYYAETLANKINGNIHIEKEGIGKSRNDAIKMAKGEIIVIQDSDDLSHKDRLRKTWNYFKKHKDIDIAYGSFQYIDHFGKPSREEPAKEFNEEELRKHNYIAHPTVAFRKNIGVSYRDDCMVLDDWFFYLDCMNAGKKFGVIKDVLSFYRVLETSVSRSGEKNKIVEQARERFLNESNTSRMGL
jgi:glycosyltransferase EpsE